MIEKISVTTKYLKVSLSKLQKILNKLKGKNYKEALIFLEKMPQNSSRYIWQSIKAAGANASHNYSLPKDELRIKEAFANKSCILKRIHARARGKAYRIEKKLSHLTISLNSK